MSAFSLATALVLALALILGGGTFHGLPGDVVAQLASLPLLGVALLRLRRAPTDRFGRLALLWLGLVAVVILVQCLPLPYPIWTQLSGRADLAADLRAAGVAAGAHPLSLDVHATERALWTLLPAAAIFIAMLTLSSADRRRLTAVTLAIAAVSVALGLAQVAAGRDSALRFYLPTNPSEAVGFFANRNHYAALLYMALMLATAWLAGLVVARRELQPVPVLRVIAIALVGVLLILGLVLSRSRAGIMLGMFGLIGSVAVAWSIARRDRRATRVVTMTAMLGIALAIQYGLWGVLARLQNDPLDDARWTFLHVTLDAAHRFAPFGSGFGTFLHAYQNFETRDVTMSVIANHAHDDWAESWLEGGWPAAVLAALFLVWFAVGAVRVWRRRQSDPVSTALARAAPIAILLVLLHELTDYPLRTTADMTVFALMCGLLTATPRSTGHRDFPSAPERVAKFGRGSGRTPRSESK
ncbi:MAG TPA: O-antigen ligase family protein [Rhodanobacteraceae bacterium]|nr:O-antigen ligase family protein [Rhodanobacteraceae bacterium]